MPGLILLFSIPRRSVQVPSVIYPAASESTVAVSICPVILAVYHDYIPEGCSIHRLTVVVRIARDGFMHAVSRAMVHFPLFPLLLLSLRRITFLIFLMRHDRAGGLLFSYFLISSAHLARRCTRRSGRLSFPRDRGLFTGFAIRSK